MKWWRCKECHLTFRGQKDKNEHAQQHIRRLMHERSWLYTEIARTKKALDRWTDVWEPPK
jgi:hypothetical protein